MRLSITDLTHLITLSPRPAQEEEKSIDCWLLYRRSDLHSQATKRIQALTGIAAPRRSNVSSRTKENDGLQCNCRHGGVCFVGLLVRSPMLLLPIACRRPPLANSESGSGRSFYVFWVLCYVVKLSRLCASWFTLIYRASFLVMAFFKPFLVFLVKHCGQDPRQRR